jgi:hypothetical protein
MKRRDLLPQGYHPTGGQTPNSKIVAFKGSETKAKPKNINEAY